MTVGAVATVEVVDDGRSWRERALPGRPQADPENGLDPGRIPGTGAGGRITRDDVLNYLALKPGGDDRRRRERYRARLLRTHHRLHMQPGAARGGDSACAGCARRDRPLRRRSEVTA